MQTLQKYRHLSWLLLLIPIYMFLFLKLGAAHIRLWDEGWFTVHAIEMLEHGSLFVSYFKGEPSFTSSKPPLHTWLQMLSISALGINELAVRLPSAIAAAVTVLLLFFFVRRKMNTQVAMMAAMILLTSIGFIGFHTARGAEADSLLTLTLVAQMICVFNFLETRQWKWLFGTFALVGLSFWTKSVAAFLLLPGFMIYTLIFDREIILKTLKSWQFYSGIAATILIVIGYVMIRENAQPGYLGMFFKSNVGRYTASVGHDNGWEYYLRNMLDGRYVWWMAFAVLGMIFSFSQGTAESKLPAFATICAVSYFLVISFSRSKLVWYDMPFYPLAAIPAAFGIQRLFVGQVGWKKSVLVAVLFLFPTYQMFLNAQADRLNLQEMDFESQEIFLQQAFKKKKDLDNLIVVHGHFEGAILFYKHKFETINQHLTLQNTLEGIGVGDRVLVRNQEQKDEMFSKFDSEVLDGYRSAELYKITGVKQEHLND